MFPGCGLTVGCQIAVDIDQILSFMQAIIGGVFFSMKMCIMLVFGGGQWKGCMPERHTFSSGTCSPSECLRLQVCFVYLLIL